MARTSPKPETPAAKADAALTATHRKVHPDYDADVIRFGVRVADYNAGWLAGSENERKKHRPR
jgi:hypothetical protein